MMPRFGERHARLTIWTKTRFGNAYDSAVTRSRAPFMRIVQCRRHGKELPGLEAPPMPGPLGDDIYEHVSAKAWQEWQTLQTMLINEHHLSLRDADARKYLLDQMNRFFRNEETETPEGYIEPED